MLRKLLEKIPFTWYRIISWNKSNPDKWELIDILEAHWLTSLSSVKHIKELAMSNPRSTHIDAYPFATDCKFKGMFFIDYKWRLK